MFIFKITLKLCVQSSKSPFKRSLNSSSIIYNKENYILKKSSRLAQKTMHQVSDPNLLSPPDTIRGLKKLDKSLFKKEIQVCALYLNHQSNNISKIMPHLKKYLLKMENLKPIQTQNSDNTKYVLLNPIYVKAWSDFTENDKSALLDLGLNDEHLKTIDFTIQYENWKPDELLKYILPEDKESVAGFSKIGHILHLNLRDHVMEYKNIIGEILLEKIVGCRTVVNKLDKIDNTYRNFQMEVLCGDNDMRVVVKENRCLFEFDFSTVYWNPRLSTEHERIVNILQSGDVLYDVFAGVGPFSIPAAKKKCKVLANDLNPESYKWLNHNGKINKTRSEYLKTFNKDGRDFILNDLKNDLLVRWRNSDFNNIYITMNLPALAPEFLPNFKNLFSAADLQDIEINKYPKVFVYLFAKGENPVEIARDLVEKNLGCKLPENVEIFNVRKVSSFKEMMRVSFELSREYLVENTCNKRAAEDDVSTSLKKSV